MIQQQLKLPHIEVPRKAAYRWKVTKDKIADENQDATGTEGPYNCTAEVELTDRWRCKDDDGEIYYYGLIGGDYEGFEPLDDFCAPNAGCTEIEYFENGVWVLL